MTSHFERRVEGTPRMTPLNALLEGGVPQRIEEPTTNRPDAGWSPATPSTCPSAGTGRQARFATACPFRASGSDPRLGHRPNREPRDANDKCPGRRAQRRSVAPKRRHLSSEARKRPLIPSLGRSQKGRGDSCPLARTTSRLAFLLRRVPTSRSFALRRLHDRDYRAESRACAARSRASVSTSNCLAARLVSRASRASFTPGSTTAA